MRLMPNSGLVCVSLVTPNIYLNRFDSALALAKEAQDEQGRVGMFTSASPRCLDGGDVDLLHRHHRLEGTLCLTATSRKRIG
jgi:hypothetical protein